jgi:hypothetical protein
MVSKITTIALAGTAALFLAAAPAQARWHHHHHHWHGGGVGAGIAGFAAGALIGGALAASQPNYYYAPGYVYAPAPSYAPSVAWCERHYRSYDPASGTYLGYDGVRHPCP